MTLHAFSDFARQLRSWRKQQQPQRTLRLPQIFGVLGHRVCCLALKSRSVVFALVSFTADDS